MRTFLDGRVMLHAGDCLEVLATLTEASVDSVVCDPPYELGFMGKKWDGTGIANSVAMWAHVFRVLKPGGHLVAFSGTRTYHRMVCAIEDAGFEIRDQIGWAYGSGFPKSHDVSKGIDRAAGAERKVIAPRKWAGRDPNGTALGRMNDDAWVAKPDVLLGETAPATDSAKQWEGWGTALKPSYEPLCVAQKPLDYGQNIAIIGSHVAVLWSRLWSMLSAKGAAKFSALSPAAWGVEPSAFAQWSADDASNTRAALCAQMGTSQFELALISSLSTALSWSDTLAAASVPENTSTIETELRATIGWRTLRSLLSKITVESIILAHRTGRWSIANASPAERAFNASVLRLSSILELSALAPAIAKEADSSLAVGASPNWQSICLARKPLIGTVAENVLRHGTGAINIAACRVEAEDKAEGGACKLWSHYRDGAPSAQRRYQDGGATNFAATLGARGGAPEGRWPANLIHDGSEEVLKAFPDRDGASSNSDGAQKTEDVYGDYATREGVRPGRNDSGSAARFFYTAKADSEDRLGSKHPTVKPIDLMQWLVRLVTPKGGVVLDPFAGTGTTGEAAWREGLNAILIEREPEYQADIARRMELAVNPTKRAAVAKSKNKLDNPEDLPLFALTTSC